MEANCSENPRERATSSRVSIALRPFEWLLLAALAAVFAPAVLSLSETWSRLDYYSHGYLVPFAAIWAATAQRGVLPRLPMQRRPLGAGLLALSLLVYAAGVGASLVSLQGLALVMALASAIYFARGAAWARALMFSISYLLFMVPVPDSWLNPLIARLQLLVSGTAVQLLHWASMPVYRDGNVMHLPGGESLFVAEACSGITSIVTLVPLAVFLAYFTERTMVRRLVLLVSVIPLAMAGNLLRVVGTIVAAGRFGADVATSDAVHEWAGILTYVLGCLALLAIGELMRRVFPEAKRAPVR